MTLIGTPVKTTRQLDRSASSGNCGGQPLTEALKKDDHIAPFMQRGLPDGTVKGIPSKDNGLDVEGLAVSGNRVFLGLRGPVLRGWTVVIELVGASSMTF